MTNQQTKILAVVGIAGAGWWLYTRSKGLTLTGQYANTMLPPGTNDRLSLVRPSLSTSTGATNPFAQIAANVTSILGNIFRKAPGNGSGNPAPSSTVDPRLVGNATAGLAIPQDEPAPWGFTDVFLPNFDFVTPAQSAAGIASLSYTLDPSVLGFDPNYIPPPPGR